MKTTLTLALFAAATSSLFAQRYEPTTVPAQKGTPTAEPQTMQEPVVTPAAPSVKDTASEPTVTPFEPVADKGLHVGLWVEQDKHLALKIDAPDAGVFLGLVFAAVKDARFHYPGMPELLMGDALVASGIGQGSMRFEMGPVNLGFPIYLQALAINERVAGASEIVELKPAK